MTAQTQRNESLENFRTYTEKPSKQEQDKTSNNTTYKQRNKENIKEQKKV